MEDYAINIYKDVLIGARKRFPQGFWRDDESKNFNDAAKITRYLIEDVLHWDNEKIKTELSCKVFFEHKLKGMLCMVFGDSIYAAVNNAYPGKFKEWELSYTPRNFWNMDTAREATIWLFRERLGFNDEQIKQHISRKIFVENGLDTMMHVLFSNNARLALSNAFPELFE